MPSCNQVSVMPTMSGEYADTRVRKFVKFLVILLALRFMILSLLQSLFGSHRGEESGTLGCAGVLTEWLWSGLIEFEFSSHT